MTWQERYKQAHRAYKSVQYPNYYADGGDKDKIVIPKVGTSNGLTNCICNYLKYTGGIGNRINVSGRLVEKTVKTQMGVMSAGKKFIKSSTLKGTADIIALLPNGKTLHIEIKVGNDKPREAQLEMQQRIRKANGVYEFIHNMDEFFTLYDLHMNEQCVEQKTLF